MLSDLGERDAARTAYTEALTIYRRLAQQHPAAFEPDVATTLNNLGNVLSDLGERDAARTAYTETLTIYRRLAQQHPAAFEPDVATTLNNLGDGAERPGRAGRRAHRVHGSLDHQTAAGATASGGPLNQMWR